MFGGSYQARRVLVTGHTGFKGSWLCEWLLLLGAEVHGYALDPEPHMTLYEQLALGKRIAGDHRRDITDLAAVRSVVHKLKPEFVFHLAAQPLVRLSYELPVLTFNTNVMGTTHLLEAVRQAGSPCAVVVVTTDKCYENKEWVHAYRECDELGGHDPYSASKAAAEIVVDAYRRSFFEDRGSAVRVASARAGNVIGGGDWARDRIVPDAFRAFSANQPLRVRNPGSIRPWQHVMEPLGGYLWLAATLRDPGLLGGSVQGEALQGPFNFGPNSGSHQTVRSLIEELLKSVDGAWEDVSDGGAPHEAGRLALAVDKALHVLHWRPAWDFERTIAETAAWYVACGQGGSVAELTARQLTAYAEAAREAGLAWTC